MSPSIRQRLLNAQQLCLLSLKSHEKADLYRFESTWSELKDDIQLALDCGSVDASTQDLVHSIASFVGIVVSTFAELEECYEELSVKLYADIDQALEDYGKSGNPRHLSSTDFERSLPRRNISFAAKWLSQNFHNPYPSNIILDNISRQAKWDRKDVNGWFLEARRRIGWNGIRKRFFGGRQAEAVKVATDFFNGTSGPLDHSLELALRTMEARIQELYIEPFTESKIVRSLNITPKDKIANQEAKIYPLTDPKTFPPEAHDITPTAKTTADGVVEPSRPAPPTIALTRKRCRSTDPTDNLLHNEPRGKRTRCNDLTIMIQRKGLGSPATSESDAGGKSSYRDSMAITPRDGLPSSPASQSNSSEKIPSIVAAGPSPPDRARPRRSSSAVLPKGRRRASDPESHRCLNYPSGISRTIRPQAVSNPTPSPLYSKVSAVPVSQPHQRSHSTSDSPRTNQPSTSIPSPIDISSQTFDLCALVPSIPLPAVSQSTTVRGPPSLEHMLPSSFELPAPATCDLPAAMGMVDLTLYNSAEHQDIYYSEPGLTGSASLSPSSGISGGPCQPAPLLDLDITLNTGANDWLMNDQGLNLLPSLTSSLEQSAVTSNPAQTNRLASVDIDFGAIFNLDAFPQPQEPHPYNSFAQDSFLTDPLDLRNLMIFQVPPMTSDTMRAAKLEELKKRKELIQQQIQSLERQIDGRICV